MTRQCGPGANAASSPSGAPGEPRGSSLLAEGAVRGTVRCSAAQIQLMLASSVAGYYFLAATLNGQFLESNDHAFAHGKRENPLDRADFKSLFSLLSYLTLSRHVRCSSPEVQLHNTPVGFGWYFKRRTLQVCKLFNSLEVSSCILTCLSLTALPLLSPPQKGGNAAFVQPLYVSSVKFQYLMCMLIIYIPS